MCPSDRGSTVGWLHKGGPVWWCLPSGPEEEEVVAVATNTEGAPPKAPGYTTGTMRAIVRYRYGSPDILELKYVDKPEIADDEVLVRVRAAGVDRGVWHIMTGLAYPIRLAGFGLRAPKNPVIGMDLAGVVETVGKDVSRVAPGDEVFGIGKGSYAEYAPALETKLAPKPSNLTFEQAAVLAISGSTALQAVRDHGKVRQGQKVLIIGASGGVGTYAVQSAKAFGAHVTGVCSTKKAQMVRSIGAGEGGGKWLGGIDRQLRATMLSPFVGQKLGTFINKENYQYMLVLKDLTESGKVTPVIDRSYPLAEVPEAIRYMERGHTQGKVVITI